MTREVELGSFLSTCDGGERSDRGHEYGRGAHIGRCRRSYAIVFREKRRIKLWLMAEGSAQESAVADDCVPARED